MLARWTFVCLFLAWTCSAGPISRSSVSVLRFLSDGYPAADIASTEISSASTPAVDLQRRVVEDEARAIIPPFLPPCPASPAVLSIDVLSTAMPCSATESNSYSSASIPFSSSSSVTLATNSSPVAAVTSSTPTTTYSQSIPAWSTGIFNPNTQTITTTTIIIKTPDPVASITNAIVGPISSSNTSSSSSTTSSPAQTQSSRSVTTTETPAAVQPKVTDSIPTASATDAATHHHKATHLTHASPTNALPQTASATDSKTTATVATGTAHGAAILQTTTATTTTTTSGHAEMITDYITSTHTINSVISETASASSTETTLTISSTSTFTSWTTIFVPATTIPTHITHTSAAPLTDSALKTDKPAAVAGTAIPGPASGSGSGTGSGSESVTEAGAVVTGTAVSNISSGTSLMVCANPITKTVTTTVTKV